MTTRLIDITATDELPVPSISQSSFRSDNLFEYVDSSWNHAVARYTNQNGLRSEATLYDTGIYEALGSGLCYSTGRSHECDYAISSQDLELCLVTILQFYRDVLPDDHSETVYAILSGTNLTNTTMDQYRQVERVESFPGAHRTSRLSAISLPSDGRLRDQLTPLLRPFSTSQYGYHPRLYFDDDGDWELAGALE